VRGYDRDRPVRERAELGGHEGSDLRLRLRDRDPERERGRFPRGQLLAQELVADLGSVSVREDDLALEKRSYGP
jgi:hypothetical protein